MISVGAAIIKKEDKILICQRGDNSSFANLWEFLGGKQESYENIEECVVRECKEELDIEIEVKGIFKKAIYQYPDKEINFTFFNATIRKGEVKLNEHKDYKWVLPEELSKYNFCPADIEVAKQIIEIIK